MNNEMAVVPPGGYKFFQRLPNGGMQLFVGLSEQDLMAQVKRFRMNNNIDVGDLPTEVRKGISGAAHTTASLKDERSLRERVTGWKSNRAFLKMEFVEQDEAERRAAICVDCPYNQVKYADDCIECFSGTERDLYAMRQGRSTSQDLWLGACEICGHENKTAVHLSENNLKHVVNYAKELEEKAPKCWCNQIARDQRKEVS